MRTRTKKQRESTEIDLTSLIDVIFLLLIFFMVATSFHEETRVLDIDLPRALNPKVITIDENVLSIMVTKDNRIFLNNDEIEPSNLTDELNTRAKKTGFRNVIIKGDAETSYRNIVAVIDAANAVETKGISFAVLYTTM